MGAEGFFATGLLISEAALGQLSLASFRTCLLGFDTCFGPFANLLLSVSYSFIHQLSSSYFFSILSTSSKFVQDWEGC